MKKFLSVFVSTALTASVFAMIPTDITAITDKNGLLKVGTKFEIPAFGVEEVVKDFDILNELRNSIYGEGDFDSNESAKEHQEQKKLLKQNYEDLKKKMEDMGAVFDACNNMLTFPLITNKDQGETVATFFNAQKNLSAELSTQDILIQTKTALLEREMNVLYYGTDVVKFIEKLLNREFGILRNPDATIHCCATALKSTHPDSVTQNWGNYKISDVDPNKLNYADHWVSEQYKAHFSHILSFVYPAPKRWSEKSIIERYSSTNFKTTTFKKVPLNQSHYFEYLSNLESLESNLSSFIVEHFSSLEAFTKDLDLLNNTLRDFDRVQKSIDTRLTAYEENIRNTPHDKPITVGSSEEENLKKSLESYEKEKKKFTVLKLVEEALSALENFIKKDLNLS